MKLQRSDVIIRFLLWPQRQELGLRRIEKGAVPQGLTEHFTEYLTQFFRSHTRDDVEAMAYPITEETGNLVTWYTEVLRGSGMDITFADAQPRLAQHCFSNWRAMTTRLDADALLSLEFVQIYGRSARAADLAKWGVYATSNDHNLKRLFSRGLADIHTHLEGCQPIPLLWLRLMLQETRLAHFSEYRRVELAKNRAYRLSLGGLRQEKNAVIRAMQARDELCQRLGRLPLVDHAVTHFPSLVSGQLWQERSLLGRAWHTLKDNFRDEMAGPLDAYLFGKNLFLARHVQSPWGNPGLTEFRHYFQRAKLLGQAKTPRVEWLHHRRMVHFASESRHIRHIEFRISPFDTATEYARFFKRWQENVARDPLLSRTGMDIRFVIHFIRQPVRGDRQEEIPFKRLRISLDQQSAALHLFRIRYPDLAQRVVGIDVANLERTCPPHIFTPYIRLLRGQQQTLFPSPFLQHWGYLQRRKWHLPPPGLKQLGLTFHAGEDYFHPLDGMRTMYAAITGMQMHSGDRLGHALAAGRSIRHFDLKLGESLFLPQGDALDNLVWLYDQLSRHPDGFASKGDPHGMAQMIGTLSEAIYGRTCTPAQLIRVLELRHDVPKRYDHGDDESRRLRHMELYDRQVRNHRHELKRIPDIFGKLHAAVETAQAILMQMIADKGIIIEFNPSSNFATGGMETLAYHPYFTYRNTLGDDKLLATINCDDPGTFATRIENEYACMLNALTGRDVSPNEALSILEAMRTAGLDSCFGELEVR